MTSGFPPPYGHSRCRITKLLPPEAGRVLDAGRIVGVSGEGEIAITELGVAVLDLHTEEMIGFRWVELNLGHALTVQGDFATLRLRFAGSEQPFSIERRVADSLAMFGMRLGAQVDGLGLDPSDPTSQDLAAAPLPHALPRTGAPSRGPYDPAPSQPQIIINNVLAQNTAVIPPPPPPPSRIVVVKRTGPNHTFHLIMTLVSCGLWLPIWIIDVLRNS